MTFNVGVIDRLVRFVVGIVLILLPGFSGLSLFANPAWFWAAIIVGAVLVLTALFRFCPLYRLLGISTRKA